MIKNCAPVLRQKSRHTKFINSLSKIALTVKSIQSARIAAGIVYKNELIATGYNVKKSHPFHAKFSKNEESIYFHAETLAINNALKILNEKELENAHLYICRVKYTSSNKNSFEFGLCKPCSGCIKAIDKFKFKKVIYTLDGNGVGIL